MSSAAAASTAAAPCTSEPDVEYDTVSVLRHCSWMLRRLLPLNHRLRDLDATCDVGGDSSGAPVHIKDREGRIGCIVDVLAALDHALRLHKEDLVRSQVELHSVRAEMADELLLRHAEKVWTTHTFQRHLAKTRFDAAAAANVQNGHASRFGRSLAKAYDAAVNSTHARTMLVNELRSMPSAYALADSHVLAQCTQDAPCWLPRAEVVRRQGAGSQSAIASASVASAAHRNAAEMQNAGVAREQLLLLRGLGHKTGPIPSPGARSTTAHDAVRPSKKQRKSAAAPAASRAAARAAPPPPPPAAPPTAYTRVEEI